jgi:phytoene dehydrogenase-like protein
VDAEKLPKNMPDHHQIIRSYEGKLGEGESLFLSFSPEWDSRRAPERKHAVTVSTHTAVKQWWDLLNADEGDYRTQKQEYTERIINTIDSVIEGFKGAISIAIAGSPLTYAFYTLRYQGMVGGFPQSSLFKARSPKTGIANLRLVGDSIFPGQSTAGVTLGGMRVAEDVCRNLPVSQAIYSAAKRPP